MTPQQTPAAQPAPVEPQQETTKLADVPASEPVVATTPSQKKKKNKNKQPTVDSEPATAAATSVVET